MRQLLARMVLAGVIALAAVPNVPAAGASDWKTILLNRLPVYGHRNWIVIADSAYPAQTAPGIETVYSDAEQTEVLNFVLRTLASSRHVGPILYTDRELRFLADQEVPGIEAYRTAVQSLAGDRKVNTLPHADLIAKLAEVSQNFRVLIIKTRMAMPYTTVFLQLDCAYWTPEQEQRLRAVIAANH